MRCAGRSTRSPATSRACWRRGRACATRLGSSSERTRSSTGSASSCDGRTRGSRERLQALAARGRALREAVASAAAERKALAAEVEVAERRNRVQADEVEAARARHLELDDVALGHASRIGLLQTQAEQLRADSARVASVLAGHVDRLLQAAQREPTRRPGLAGTVAPVKLDRLAAGAQLDRAKEACPLGRARPALGHGQSRAPASRRPPAAAGRPAPRSRFRPRPGPRPLRPARDDFSRSVSLRDTRSSSRVAHGRLARALRAARPLDLEREDRRDRADEIGGVRLTAVAVVHPADDGAGDGQVPSRSLPPSPASTARSSSGDAHATASTRLDAIDDRDAGIERARARARHFGQAGAVLDGLGDRS